MTTGLRRDAGCLPVLIGLRCIPVQSEVDYILHHYLFSLFKLAECLSTALYLELEVFVRQSQPGRGGLRVFAQAVVALCDADSLQCSCSIVFHGVDRLCESEDSENGSDLGVWGTGTYDGSRFC